MAGLKFKIALVGLMFWSATALAAANTAPVIARLEAKDILIGETLTFKLTAFDPQNQKVTFSSENLPPGATLDPAGGVFTWKPAINQVGEYKIIFLATDSGTPKFSDTATVGVRVIFRTTLLERTFGFGVQEKQTLFETSNPADLLPRVTKVSIDGQVYTSLQKELLASENPQIKIELSSPFDIDRQKISVLLDGQALEITPSDIRTFGAQQNVLSLSLGIAPKNLAAGAHTLSVQSGNLFGPAAQSIILSAGGLRLLDNPLTFPSPYNPSSGGSVIIQYTLSQAADIEIIIVGATQEILKKMPISRGDEGGKAGLNKVSWDGKTILGQAAANGIYLAAIIDKGAGKTLGKAKIVVYR